MPEVGNGQAQSGPKVVLASGSPRRRELLGFLGVAFHVQVSGEDENSPETDPAKLAGELALLKGRAVAVLNPDAVVIAADTVVAIEGELLSKPQDESENAAFIRRLAGRTHEVFTGVAVISPTQETVEVARTAVTFRALNDAEVAFYARSGEGLDKAGGYGIQGLGMALVSHLDGEYSNVVGFPLTVVTRLLRRAGVPVWDSLETAGVEALGVGAV